MKKMNLTQLILIFASIIAMLIGGLVSKAFILLVVGLLVLDGVLISLIEKHDLFKSAALFVLNAIVFSWVISSSYFSSGVLSSDEITRVGVFDLTTYGLLGFYYFTTVFLFTFVVAGFYKFLGSTNAYKSMTDSIANLFNGKEKVLVAISTLLIACISGVATEYLVLFAIIPFFISILAKLKVDKITGLMSTFGGILIGILGSTYSTKIVGQLVDASTGLGVAYGYELIATVVLFFIAYVLLMFFTFRRMGKVEATEENTLTDPFASVVKEEKKSSKKVVVKKANFVGLAIVLAITFILLVLAFIDWENVFGVTVFTKLHTWITEATLFNSTIFSYILGSSAAALGTWDLLAGAGLLFIMTLIIKVMYRIPFDTVLDEYAEGFKKINKSILVLLTVYLVLEFTVIFPTVPAFVSKTLELGTNVGTLFVSGLFTSVFTVEFQYVVSLIGSVFATFSNVSVAALTLQTAYGMASFIAPTSAILMLGLSLLDIKYKDYFKFIWKFLIALLVVVFAILLILLYV